MFSLYNPSLFPYTDMEGAVIYIGILLRQQVQERKAEMDKEKKEKFAQKKSNEMFNSITEKVKPENQNQTHNSRREGMGPNTKRKPN